MPELSADVISFLGLLVLVVLVGTPGVFRGLTDSSPEHEPPRTSEDLPPPPAG